MHPTRIKGTHMKHKIFTLFFALTASINTVFAASVQIGDLYYNLDATTLTAEVTSSPSIQSQNLINVVIPSSVTYGGTAYSVTSIGEKAFPNCSNLTSVSIPNSVTNIGKYAFQHCSNLTSIIIPNSVTNIEDNAFYDCPGLTSITIPNSVTSLGSSVFSECIGLFSISVPNSVTTIGSHAFYGIPNVVYSGTATGSPWGATCVNGYVDGDFVYTDSQQNVLAACKRTAVGGIVIPNSVTNIGDMAFYYCVSLTSVTIPNSVTSIGDMAFYHCVSLTSVTIPNSVTSIGDHAFYSCVSLTSVTIPNSVISIGESAFEYCSLRTATINSHVIGDKMFYGCSELQEVNIGHSVTSIGDHAFCHCVSLTSITIPDSVTSIGSMAFNTCISLFSISVPNSVTTIGSHAFSGIPNVVYSGTATGSPWGAMCVNGYMHDDFVYTDSQRTVLVACKRTAVGGIVIPNSVTTIKEKAFYGCVNLTSINIPNSVTSLESSVFSECISLFSISVPNSVTTIGSHAFSGIPNVVYSGTATGSPWGAMCVNGYMHGDFVYTDSQRTALVACKRTAVGAITIPNSVTNIGQCAFYNCTGLTSVYCKASTPPTLGEPVFEPVVDTLYVPANAVNTYKNSNWKDYFTYIYAICVVTFEDQSGNEISQQLVLSGDSVIAPEMPDIYGYTFTGWDKDLSNVTEDMVVTAQYTRDAIDGLYYIYDQTQGTATLDREGNSYARMTKLEVPDKVYYRGTMFTVTAVGTQALDGCDRLAEVVIPNTVEDIQTYAFNGCSDLAHLTLGAGVRNIAAYAFNGCRRLEDITVYADRVIDLTATSFNNVGDKSYIPVYVPETRLQYYQRDQYWSEFNLQVKSAEVVPDMTSTSVIVEPEETTASLTWPETADAASYDLVIRDGNGDIICSLQFDKDGRLIGIDFGGGQNNVAERVMMPQKHESENGFGTTSGFRFTVTGLSQGTDYSLRLAANNESNMPLDIYTATFKTKGVNQNIDNVQGDDLQSTKVLRDGQILILRGDNVYTTQGQRVQ